jgi:hypothetical protein
MGKVDEVGTVGSAVVLTALPVASAEVHYTSASTHVFAAHAVAMVSEGGGFPST